MDELDGLVEPARVDRVRSEPLRQAGVERPQRLMGDDAAQTRVHRRVDRLRVEKPLHEPHRRAVDETLELGGREATSLPQPSQHRRAQELRLTGERTEGAVELAAETARGRQSPGLALVGRRERRDRPRPLAFGRSEMKLPREPGQSTPAREAQHVGPAEPRHHLVPEGAGLERAAVVGCRFPDEIQAPPRPRAGRVEQIPIPGEGIGAHEPRARGARLLELAAASLGQERRLDSPPGQHPFLEAEHEHDLKAPGPRACRIEHDDAPPIPRARRHRELLDDLDDDLGACVAAERLPGLDLVQRTPDRLFGQEIEPGRLSDRRPIEPPGGAKHPGGERAYPLDHAGCGPQLVQHPDRMTEQPYRLGFDPFGALTARPRSRPSARSTRERASPE